MHSRRARPLACLTALCLCLPLIPGCDDYPRDPEGTLGRVTGGTLRVGVSEARPWVWRQDGEATGVEADLVRELAAELGAEVEWNWGGQEEHLAALERFELDLVIGGVTQATPWSKRIGPTRPFADYKVIVAFPRDERQPLRLDGLEIAVPAGSDVAADLRSRGAIPAPVDDFWENGPPPGEPVAIGEWALDPLGMTRGPELARRRHVLAVPPGENGWLVRIERFLEAQKPTIDRRLAESLPTRRPSTMPQEGSP